MRILVILVIITLCGCVSAPTGLYKGMYYETFHQTYADRLDGWMERPFGFGLTIGDYYWTNGPRAIIIWRGSEEYTPTLVDYQIYHNDFDDYDWLEKYKNPSCEE